MATTDPESRRPRDDARVPPHNLEAEESLLGAMLLSRDAIVAATEVGVTANDFYKPAHGHVFDAITSLYAIGEPPDPVTVGEELSRAGLLAAIGGPAVLVTLQARTPSTSSAGRYARIVSEHALLRRMIAVGGRDRRDRLLPARGRGRPPSTGPRRSSSTWPSGGCGTRSSRCARCSTRP